jgi:hypothetical protein
MPPLHHGPHLKDEQKPQLVSAQSLPSGRVIGTVAVEEKSNEIPAARALLEKLGPLDGKLLILDALHSCQQTIEMVPVPTNQHSVSLEHSYKVHERAQFGDGPLWGKS